MDWSGFRVAGIACLLSIPAPVQPQASVNVNGTTIAYRDVGQGPALVLLHGFGETGGIWDPLVPVLGESFRLIIPDLRGHGRSSNPLPYFTHRDAASDLIGLLERLAIRQANAVGFSTGGMVLLHVATEVPDLVPAMALVGTAPYLPESAREIMGSIDVDGMPMESLETMGLVHGDTAQARILLRQFVALKDNARDVNFTPPLLSTITARTLVVHGDRDPFFPVSVPVDVFRSIPDAYLMIFPGLDHRPFPEGVNAQAYFVDSLMNFFSDSWN